MLVFRKQVFNARFFTTRLCAANQCLIAVWSSCKHSADVNVQSEQISDERRNKFVLSHVSISYCLCQWKRLRIFADHLQTHTVSRLFKTHSGLLCVKSTETETRVVVSFSYSNSTTSDPKEQEQSDKAHPAVHQTKPWISLIGVCVPTSCTLQCIGRVVGSMTNKKILAARLFQTAAEPNASPERLDVLAKDAISIRETRWLVENEPWVVNEISNTACGIWATYLTDVSMHALQDRPRDRENKILHVLPSKEAIICSIQSLDNLKAHPDAYNCWVKTEKLLKYFSDECHQCGSKAPIHVLIQWGFPNWIIWLAAKLYPQQVREFDDKANLGLPIHHCTYCGTKPFQVEGYQIQFSAGFRSEHPELYRPTSLYLLAKLYPDGATLRVSRNGPHVVVQGDLPLHTYLGYQHGEPNNSCFDLEDAKKLVELAPKSLLQKSVRIDDCVEHIFPFMVAAIPDYSRWKEAYKWRGNAMRVGESRQEIQRRNWDRINAAELEQLTAIFWLLREDPSALQAAIHSQHDYPCT